MYATNDEWPFMAFIITFTQLDNINYTEMDA